MNDTKNRRIWGPLLATIAVLCMAATGCPPGAWAGDAAIAGGEQTASTESPGPDRSAVERTGDDLLILELRLGAFVLSDSMYGFLRGGSLMLPLGEVVRSLEFPISVDPAGSRAGGWFLKENRLFSLDVTRRELVVEGRRTPFDAALVEVQEDDILIDIRLLAQWFPIDISYEISELQVVIESREPLPIEQRLERRERRQKMLSARRQEDTDYPALDIPYAIADWPFIDTSIEFAFRSDEDNNRTRNGRYNALLTGDLLKMNADLFLAGNNDEKLSQARLKMGRKDPGGGLFGPLAATEFSVGDIFTSQVPLVSRTQIGRGIAISNIPLNQPTEFDRITLNGDLQVGWEVELYRNEVLLDFRSAQADGRYEFADVPLLFGVNVLRLAFYGPQGQVREKIRQLRVGPGQIKPGEHHMRITANQQDTQLLLGKIDDPLDEDLQGKGRVVVEYQGGINQSLSLNASLTSLPLAGGQRTYLGAGARATVGPVFGGLDLVHDLTGGTAGTISAQTGVMGVNIIGEQSVFSNFVSEQVVDTDDRLRSRTKLRLDGVAHIASLPHVPFSLTGEHDRRESGDSETKLSNRLSTALGRATVSNTLNWQLSRTDDSQTSTINGTALVGGSISDVRVRGQLSYSVDPVNRFTNSALSADWRLTEDINLRAGVDKSLTDDRLTTVSGGASMRFDHFSLGFNVDYTDRNEVNGRLTMTMSAGRDPRNGEIAVRPGSLADHGAMAARVFVDKNLNGVFDETDEPIEGVTFRADRSLLQVATDAMGGAFISGLDPHQKLDVAIASESLENPFWVSQPAGVTVVPRPGAVGVVDFPVVTTGEIDGLVYRRVDGQKRHAADVVLQLLDSEGTVIKEVKSAYDGFYLFDFVRPGRYVLRIDPAQMARLGMTASAPQDVDIAGDGTIVNGVEFTVELPRNGEG